MIPLELLALLAALGAGVFGALAGIGGGIIVVPLLAVGLGVPLHNAIAVSLLGVIAVSTTASANYLEAGLVSRTIGLTLLVSTTLGGIVGGFVAGLVDARVLAALFGIVLAAVALRMFFGREPVEPETIDNPGPREFDATYIEPRTGKEVAYRVRNLGIGSVLSVFAGLLSGLLGVGGGIVNVPTMNSLMGVPIRVATTTSTYMLGATAVASAVLYFSRGEVEPALAGAVVIGSVIGGRIGARLQHQLPQRALVLIFVAIAAFFAFQMLLKATAA
ncbi:MAG TPA: sulfite exporter TauE/SafE family protein [Candidatus Limnocylindria bacterium]|nr:sulfite exporter TauE/SafE family protein [Candidatus Limnocylindria bacterium]